MLELKNIIQALLLANDKKMMPLLVLQNMLHDFSQSQILNAINEINNDSSLVFTVAEIAGGYYIKVKSSFNSYLTRMCYQDKIQQHSKTLLETIAAIAMYQPITKTGLSEKLATSVNDEIIFQLQDLQWIKFVVPKFDKQEYFCTTKEFLQYFNISSILELENKLNNILLDEHLQVVW
jgi:segregation and condensation protein B